MKCMIALTGLIAGCAFATAPGAGSTLRSDDQISGIWEFRLLPGSGGAPTDAVTGTVALLPRLNPDARVMWVNLPDPTHLGVYAADLRPLNVTRELEGPVPQAGARLSGTDSVLLVLNPAPNHGAVVLRGVLRADSVLGNWLVTSYGTGGRGRFVMWRHRCSR